MNMPLQHPVEALIADYAAGNLPEGYALVVATHLTMCDDCRVSAMAVEALGGAVLDALEPVEMAGGASDVRNRRPTAPEPERRRAPGWPMPLAEYLPEDGPHWRRIGAGVRQSRLSVGGEASARLLEIPAGAEMPHHGHNGPELTLVLKGAFRDGDEIFRAGDMEVAGPDDRHTPIALPGEPCVCLAATDAPLRLSGLARLVQPFIGI